MKLAPMPPVLYKLPADEACYVCGLEFDHGERVYRMQEPDGLVFFVHKHCAEEQMELVREPDLLD